MSGGKDAMVAAAAAERVAGGGWENERVEIGKQLFLLWARSYWLRRKKE